MTNRGSLHGKRILVLEDDFYLASDEKALLQSAGATVVGPFGSSCDEQDILGAGQVDAAVVDINLGKGPKFHFARLLASRNVPFLFVTGYDAGVVPTEFAEAPLVAKPIREPVLIEAVSRLIAGSSEGV